MKPVDKPEFFLLLAYQWLAYCDSARNPAMPDMAALPATAVGAIIVEKCVAYSPDLLPIPVGVIIAGSLDMDSAEKPERTRRT